MSEQETGFNPEQKILIKKEPKYARRFRDRLAVLRETVSSEITEKVQGPRNDSKPGDSQNIQA